MCDFFSLMYLPYIIEVTQRLSVVVNLNFKKKEDDYFFFLQKTLFYGNECNVVLCKERVTAFVEYY